MRPSFSLGGSFDTRFGKGLLKAARKAYSRCRYVSFPNLLEPHGSAERYDKILDLLTVPALVM